MSEKSVIVIGGGIAGLCTAVYAAANGYATTVFESNSDPGGLCTSWSRGGYTFDGCIHHLTGALPGTQYHVLWDEVGALDGLETVEHREFGRFIADDERELVVCADIDRTESAMREFAPGDRKHIADFCELVRKASVAQPPIVLEPPQFMHAREGLHLMSEMRPSMPVVRKTAGISVEEYARHFRDPALKRIFLSLPGDSRVSLQSLVYTLASYNTGDAAWVKGGSQSFSRRIAERLSALGGAIEYDAKVQQIVVEDGRAIGVQLADGATHRADHIISAADPHETLFGLLGVRYVDERWRALFGDLPTHHPLVQVSLGVRSDFSDLPHSYVRVFDEPRDLACLPWPNAAVTNYSFDPSTAPEGASAVVVLLHGDLERWRAIREEGEEAYAEEKAAVAARAIDLAQECLPVAHAAVEVVDVATPLTYLHYSGAWKASYRGWLPTPESQRRVSLSTFDPTVSSVAGLRMVGQWMSPGGGLPIGALAARWAVGWLCREDGREFVSPNS